MAMFAIVTGIAFLTMAFAPTTGPSFASFGAPAKIGENARVAAKVPELPVDAANVACRGQAWGDEDEDCLATIAQSAGKGDRVTIRRLASAEPMTTTPNIF